MSDATGLNGSGDAGVGADGGGDGVCKRRWYGGCGWCGSEATHGERVGATKSVGICRGFNGVVASGKLQLDEGVEVAAAIVIECDESVVVVIDAQV